MSAAEAFVADAKSRSDISDEDKALQARRHSQDTVDIVAGKDGAIPDSNNCTAFVQCGDIPLSLCRREIL